MSSFLAELKRRHVYKVAAAYGVVGWLLIQIATQVFPFFDIPNWAVRLVVLLIVIGFPVALILAWAFDLTPEGLKRTESEKKARGAFKHLWAYVVVAGALASLGLFFVTRQIARASAANDKSIAVLPFVDMSAAKDQEYFCDGVSEELLDALAKVPGLRVVARTSSFAFKGKSADVAEIARKLGVRNVLEGSLRREGNRIRVTAQLINARDGFHVWSQTFERELRSVFAVQDEITGAIVDALKVQLGAAAASTPRIEVAPDVYDLYLQALYFSNKSSEEDLRRALALFERATQREPKFARAWTGVAKSWLWLADEHVKPLDAYPAVQAAAEKALAIDGNDPEAHTYLGEALRCLRWDYAAEDAELHKALAIDPNNAAARLFLGLLVLTRGDVRGAIQQLQIAETADPLSPIVSNFYAIVLLIAGDVEGAIMKGKRTVELDPSYLYFDSALAAAYREQGRLAESLALLEKARAKTGEPTAGLAITYARMGRRDEARAVLNALIEKANTKYFAADSIAAVYVALGETDEAFRWLNRAVDEHGAPLEGLSVRLDFRPLHSDPRFAQLLRRVNLAP